MLDFSANKKLQYFFDSLDKFVLSEISEIIYFCKRRKIMSLKGLRSFVKFDAREFLKGKQLLLMQETPWMDYDSGKEIGAKLKTTIWTDDTNYGTDGTTNEGSELDVKISGLKAEAIDRNNRGFIRLINPTGTVYGEYQNELSLKADGFNVVKQNEGDK